MIYKNDNQNEINILLVILTMHADCRVDCYYRSDQFLLFIAYKLVPFIVFKYFEMFSVVAFSQIDALRNSYWLCEDLAKQSTADICSSDGILITHLTHLQLS